MSQTVMVLNATRSSTLAESCELATSFWARFRGLMGRASLGKGQALLISPEWSIHTFFMRFPIDVLFVSPQHTVMELRHAMPPNRPFAGVWGASYVIELPAGVLNETDTQIGDQLVLEPLSSST